MSTSRCGRVSTTFTVAPTASATRPGTAVTGCGTSAAVGPMPTNGCGSVTGSPFSSVTTSPSTTTGRSVSAAVTVTVCSRPSRSTTTLAGPVPASAMVSRTASQSSTGCPAQDSTVAPGCRPAAAPGAAGSPGAQAVAAGSSGRHSWTLPRVEV